MKTIGLTGGIGSGKTTVAEILEELGATVIHADLVGHAIYEPHTVGWQRVTDAFGSGILGPDQTVDRKKLGAIVFGNPAALERLNAIVHPLMFDQIRRELDACCELGHQTVVLEAAILIEANWMALVDELWLVVATTQAVTRRLAAARGLSESETASRINAQLGDAERRRFAHVVIDNTGSLDDLRKQVRIAWERSRTTV